MRGYFGLGQLSATEKSDILDQHKSLYNGYQTMQPKVSNTQPLTVYDFAGDKDGIVVNNKGEVKKYTNMGINEQVETKEGDMCEQCGGTMKEDVCEQCGSGRMEEETGHLDDIYKVRDLNLKKGDYDYVEGGGNDYGTFEGMHKNLYKEQDDDDFEDYESSYTEDGVDDPDNEDDGFEDINASEVTDDVNEQGGNVDDMDDDDVEPAYNFDSNGPISGYLVNGLEEDDMYGYEPEKEYETMESAWSDDELEEQDISGVQGIYGDMEPAYDFDSKGPGKAGPYQRFSYESELDEEDDFGFATHSGDFGGNDSEDDFKEVDEDLKESFLTQKNKISEMFNRMNKYN